MLSGACAYMNPLVEHLVRVCQLLLVRLAPVKYFPFHSWRLEPFPALPELNMLLFIGKLFPICINSFPQHICCLLQSNQELPSCE